MNRDTAGVSPKLCCDEFMDFVEPDIFLLIGAVVPCERIL
jgi:hypothetical protein